MAQNRQESCHPNGAKPSTTFQAHVVQISSPIRHSFPMNDTTSLPMNNTILLYDNELTSWLEWQFAVGTNLDTPEERQSIRVYNDILKRTIDSA